MAIFGGYFDQLLHLFQIKDFQIEIAGVKINETTCISIKQQYLIKSSQK